MNYAKPRPDVHLTRKDLTGIAASMRTIFAVSADGEFDGLLAKLDRAAGAPRPSPFGR